MKKVLSLLLVLGIAQWWFSDQSIHTPSYDIDFDFIVKNTGDSSRSEELPMLVALHGNGDTAENFYNTALNEVSVPARIILLQGPISHGRGGAWPWSAEELNKYGKAVKEAVDLLASKYPTIGKPLLLGFSGGGVMSYFQAAKYSDSYSYIFPISGELANQVADSKAINSKTKIIAFHGNKDSVVSIRGGKNAVALLKAKQANIDFIEFDGGHHGIFTGVKPQITQLLEEKLDGIF